MVLLLHHRPYPLIGTQEFHHLVMLIQIHREPARVKGYTSLIVRLAAEGLIRFHEGPQFDCYRLARLVDLDSRQEKIAEVHQERDACGGDHRQGACKSIPEKKDERERQAGYKYGPSAYSAFHVHDTGIFTLAREKHVRACRYTQRDGQKRQM